MEGIGMAAGIRAGNGIGTGEMAGMAGNNAVGRTEAAGTANGRGLSAFKQARKLEISYLLFSCFDEVSAEAPTPWRACL